MLTSREKPGQSIDENGNVYDADYKVEDDGNK